MDLQNNPIGIVLTPEEFDHVKLTYIKCEAENPEAVKPEIQNAIENEQRLLSPIAAKQLSKIYSWDESQKEEQKKALHAKITQLPSISERKRSLGTSYDIIDRRKKAFSRFEANNQASLESTRTIKNELQRCLGVLGVTSTSAD